MTLPLFFSPIIVDKECVNLFSFRLNVYIFEQRAHISQLSTAQSRQASEERWLTSRAPGIGPTCNRELGRAVSESQSLVTFYNNTFFFLKLDTVEMTSIKK